MARRTLPLLVAVLLAVAGCGRPPPEHEVVTAVGDVVRLPVAAVADGGVHFYTYKHAGTNVNFIVRTDGQGALHTHFDACYSCYHYKRGFTVEGPDLVCIACRLTYPIADETWDFIGACAPISVHSRVDGGSLVIDRELLERGAQYF